MRQKYVCTMAMAFLMTLAGAGHLKAQGASSIAGESDNRGCIMVDELEQLLHMSYDDVYDLMEEKGYIVGLSSQDIFRDTINYVVLTYQRFVFNDTANRQSSFWLYVSKDGLGNVVSLERRPVGPCSIVRSLINHAYSEDRERSMFYGSMPHNGRVDRIEVQYYEDYRDSTVMRITMRNLSERDTFVSREVARRQRIISDGIAAAKERAADNDFIGAAQMLDTLLGIYPPSDVTIETARGYILKQKENYLYANMLNAANKKGDMGQAIVYCDSLLRYESDNDSLQYVRGLMVERLKGKVASFAQFRPKIYDSLLHCTADIVNEEVNAFPSVQTQSMKLILNIHTTDENISRGSLTLTTPVKGRKAKKTLGERDMRLQTSMIRVSRSPLLQPVVCYGVNIETEERMEREIRWRTVERRVVDSCRSDNAVLAPFVEMVEDRYFVTHDTIYSAGESLEPLVKNHVRKPTRRIYTFVSVEKDCGGERFTDVTLTGFKTSSVLAPVTSFFLPGYATYQQGVHSTWVGRTLSCYLLGGISYLAFQQSKKNADIDPTDATNPLQNHIVTQVAAYGCLTIASTIYITDLVQSISYATRNISRSKQLRKDLRKQAINIQTQDIRLR